MRRSPAETAKILAKVDRLVQSGKTIKQACESLGVPVNTYYNGKSRSRKSFVIEAEPTPGRLALIIGSPKELAMVVRDLGV